jgi:hypothetical protein
MPEYKYGRTAMFEQKYNIKSRDKSVPSTEQMDLLLAHYKHLTPLELHRVGLLIYGVNLKNITEDNYRTDGVVPGVNLMIAEHVNDLTGASVDTDGRRIQVFQANDNSPSPYYLNKDTSQVYFDDIPVMAALEFPKENYLGPYYLRTDREGGKSRLVVNPHANCNSGCKWCARAYNHRDGANRIRNVFSPEELLNTVLKDPNIMTGKLDLSFLTELNIVSGDFPKIYPNKGERISLNAADYLIELVKLARQNGFKGKWYYTGHQIKQEELKRIKEEIGGGTISYTVEHVERRQELMPVKGKISLDDIQKLLAATFSEFGRENTKYTYIIGLDDPKSGESFISNLKRIAIPEVHIFSPYAPDHDDYYFREKRYQRMTDVLDFQQKMLKEFEGPVTTGSNRGSFTPDAILVDGKITYQRKNKR